MAPAAVTVSRAALAIRNIPRRLQAAEDTAENPAEGPPQAPVPDVTLLRPSEAEYSEAIPVAVGLLYRAGYDPRGLVEYWKRWQTEASQGVPGEAARRLVSETYRAIASYTPLRNPVVRSKEFLKLKQLIARI